MGDYLLMKETESAAGDMSEAEAEAARLAAAQRD